MKIKYPMMIIVMMMEANMITMRKRIFQIKIYRIMLIMSFIVNENEEIAESSTD